MTWILRARLAVYFAAVVTLVGACTYTKYLNSVPLFWPPDLVPHLPGPTLEPEPPPPMTDV